MTIPEKFIDSIFSETQSAADLWCRGQGRHVVGPLQLSKIYNTLRVNQFIEDKVGKISDWKKILVAGTALHM